MEKQGGFVLVASLLFLVIVTILTVGLLNTGLLESMMGRNFHDKSISMTHAEGALATAIHRAMLGVTGSGRVGPDAQYDVRLLSRNVCGRDYYAVLGQADFRGAETVFRSTVALKGASDPNCQPDDTDLGSLSWRIETP